MKEVPLTGGRWTPGVVRIGDTVRRPPTAASAFVAQLLTHLAAHGFQGCPRHLGPDHAGRDILSYLPGHVPPKWHGHEDHQVASAARLLRQLHDATRGFAQQLGSGDVICHHDPGPHNTVFRHRSPVAFIDFDFAAAGDPLDDIAYLAWSWCLSSRADRAPASQQLRQVRLVADAYGLTAAQRVDLPEAIVARLHRNEAFWTRALQDAGAPPQRRDRALEMVQWTRRERAFIAAQCPNLKVALHDS